MYEDYSNPMPAAASRECSTCLLEWWEALLLIILLIKSFSGVLEYQIFFYILFILDFVTFYSSALGSIFLFITFNTKIGF